MTVSPTATFVRGVMTAARPAAEMLNVPGSTSANTGTQRLCRQQIAVALIVSGGTTTSSPAPLTRLSFCCNPLHL